jgi:hypothetical protein
VSSSEARAGDAAQGRGQRRVSARTRVISASASLVLVAMLAGCGGSKGFAGTYEANIPGHLEFLSGKWQITLAKNGSLSSAPAGHRVVNMAIAPGSYWRGDTLVINGPSRECGPPSGTGTYRLKLSGATLRFERVSDGCKLRVFLLSYPYQRVR